MLISSDYSLYLKNVLGLVRSMVIKYPCTIFSTNNAMSLGGDILSPSKLDWKYYRNVSGQRYLGINTNNVSPSSMADPQMQVYSIDLKQTIDLTPETLKVNPITLKDLKSLGASYNKLLSNYPNQELLIRGIIFPVDINVAISAPAYTILSYNSSFVGKKESNLISKLQEWLYVYADKWFNIGFYVTDQLYAASFYAIMLNAIILKIIEIRLENCKTDFAHEYHIWNYLGSYFELDKYKNIIDINQATWLYRNLEYINANVGSNKILDFLNDGFANPFGLELYGFSISKNLGDSLYRLNTGQHDQLSRDVIISRYPYGTTNLASETVKHTTPEYLISLLSKSALLNRENKLKDIQNLIKSSNNTDKENIPTGIIEANVAPDASSLLVDKLAERINYWFYLTSRNYMAFSSLLALPDVSVSDVNLSAKDAALLLIYASNKIFGIDSDVIPDLKAVGIMTFPTLDGVENGLSLSRTSILSSVETQYISGIVPFASRTIEWDRYNDVAESQTYPRAIMSRDDFDLFMTDIINNKIQHVLIPTLEPSSVGKSQIRNLINIFYQNYTCRYSNETTFTQFLNRLGLDDSDWPKTTYQFIFDFIFKEFMNIDKEVSGMGDPYLSMIEILRTITSYTLTIVPGPISNNAKVVNLPFPSFENSNKIIQKSPSLIPIELLFNDDNRIKVIKLRPIELQPATIDASVKQVVPADIDLSKNQIPAVEGKIVTIPFSIPINFSFNAF